MAATLDRLTRNPRRFSPSAPWIIPAVMIVVCVFAVICLAVKLMMSYLHSRNERSKTFGRPHGSSPDIPTTPEADQTSMATTASMRTKGSLGLSTRRYHRNRPPTVSLYQMKQKQSPGSATKSSSRAHRAAMKAMSRAARAEANRSLSRDSSRQQDDNSDENSNNANANSPNLSQRSDDTDEVQVVNQSGLIYGAAASRGQDQLDGAGDNMTVGHSSANQPEVHIVQIRDLEEGNLQHSQPTWSKTESDI